MRLTYVERIVDLDRIEWPEERAGSVLEPQEYSVLKQTIHTLGLLHDIIVMECGRRIVGVAGFNRWRALREKGVKQYKVRVIPCDEKLAIMVELAENAGRGRPDQWGLLQRIKQLVIGYKVPLEEVAQITGYSVSTLNKMLRVLNKSPPKVLEYIRAGRLTVWHALELLRLKDPVDMLEYAELAAKYGWSVRELRESIDRYLQLRAERYEELNSTPVEPQPEPRPEPEPEPEPTPVPEPELLGVTPATPQQPQAEPQPQEPEQQPIQQPEQQAEQPSQPQPGQEQPQANTVSLPYSTVSLPQQQPEQQPQAYTCALCGRQIRGQAIPLHAHRQCLINAALALRKIAEYMDKPVHKLQPADIATLDQITELALQALEQQEQQATQQAETTQENTQ